MRRIIAALLAFGLIAAGEPPLVIIGGQTKQLPIADTLQLRNIASGVQCVHADASGNLTGTGADCVSSAGLLSNALTSAHIFVGNVSNIATNVAMSGDCTISNAGAITCTKTNGSSFVASATTDTTNAANISSGTLSLSRLSLTNAHIYVGNGSNNPADVALSGDCTIANTGAITCTKTGGVSFAASATTDTTNASNISSGTLNAARLPAQPYIVSLGLQGAPLANSQATYVLFEYAVTFPANFGAIASGQSSGATGTANATGSTVFSIDKRTANPGTFGTNVGSITIGAGGITATLATAGGTSYTTAAGELWRVIGPGTADGTFANLTASLVGTR